MVGLLIARVCLIGRVWLVRWLVVGMQDKAFASKYAASTWFLSELERRCGSRSFSPLPSLLPPSLAPCVPPPSRSHGHGLLVSSAATSTLNADTHGFTV